jgi:hypothetical protein
MRTLEEYQTKLHEFGFSDAAYLVRTLDQIDFDGILADFNPSPNVQLKLPRIAFFGLYDYLSMTDQRHVCRVLGFEYYATVGFGNQNETEVDALSNQWKAIIGGYTKLIVLGNSKAIGMFDYSLDFYKKLKKIKNLKYSFTKYQLFLRTS